MAIPYVSQFHVFYSVLNNYIFAPNNAALPSLLLYWWDIPHSEMILNSTPLMEFFPLGVSPSTVGMFPHLQAKACTFHWWDFSHSEMTTQAPAYAPSRLAYGQSKLSAVGPTPARSLYSAEGIFFFSESPFNVPLMGHTLTRKYKH